MKSFIVYFAQLFIHLDALIQYSLYLVYICSDMFLGPFKSCPHTMTSQKLFIF